MLIGTCSITLLGWRVPKLVGTQCHLCIIDILMHGREITYSYQVEKKSNSVALVGLQADSILT